MRGQLDRGLGGGRSLGWCKSLGGDRSRHLEGDIIMGEAWIWEGQGLKARALEGNKGGIMGV